MTNDISDLDKIILNRIQSEFPLVERPFKVIADEIGVPERMVISCVSRLKKKGIIRRIGCNFVPDKVGFVSTLCAARVPKDKIQLFSDTVNGFSGVTHNYIRENDFNVWFTFIAESMEIIEENLENISKMTGVKVILNLPATRVFKIKAKFTL